MTRLIAALAFLLLAPAGAEARHHYQETRERVAADQAPSYRPLRANARVPRIRAVAAASGDIVGHPSGCPRRAFCGCGAAVRIFGEPRRSLWLAANWFRFPRAAPAPGMAAVRRHHVMVLEADLGGGVWRVFDANGWHHMTRVHPRSIAGYTIVNPRS